MKLQMVIKKNLKNAEQVASKFFNTESEDKKTLEELQL
jgi:hypothetical protein